MSIVSTWFWVINGAEGTNLILLILALNIEQASKDYLLTTLKHWLKFHPSIILHCYNQSRLVFMIAAGFGIAKKTLDGSTDQSVDLICRRVYIKDQPRQCLWMSFQEKLPMLQPEKLIISPWRVLEVLAIKNTQNIRASTYRKTPPHSLMKPAFTISKIAFFRWNQNKQSKGSRCYYFSSTVLSALKVSLSISYQNKRNMFSS